MILVSFLTKEEMAKVGKTEEKDFCVICSSETNYAKTDHISKRVGHVKGTGQLCLDCFKRTLPDDDIKLDEDLSLYGDQSHKV